MQIEPTSEQLGAFASTPGSEPLFMLNLLRFRDIAEGSETESGFDAYGRYAALTEPHPARVGAQVLWAGLCDPALIGPSDPEWHIAAVVRYPSRAAFLAMVSDAEYLQVSKIRSASLEDSRLIPCAPTSVG